MKHKTFFLLIVLVCFLPFISLFASPNLPHTSDGGVHLPRMGAYFKALQDGHVPVRWAGDLNFGYGLPLFNFMYHTPYVIASFFIALGTSLVTTFKLVLLISFLLSGVFMWLFTKEFFGDEKKALWVTIFYQFAPFRLVELLVRGAVGGIYAYTFFPLVLFGLHKLSKKASYAHFLLTSVATGLLILSHNSLSLLFFGLCLLFAFWFRTKKTMPWISLISLIVGVLLASFYWLPALVEHKYTYGDLFMKDLFRDHFPPILHLFIPNLTNMENLRTAEISVQFGFFHTVGLLLSAILLFSKKKLVNKRIFVFALTLTAVTIFFTQPISGVLWEHISFLRQFQFPWRFLAIIAFTTSLTSISFLFIKQFMKPLIYWGVLFFVVFSTAFYWYPPQGFDIVKEQDFWDYPLNTTYFGETDVIWSAGPAKSFPGSPVEVIDGKAVVENFTKKTHVHIFGVSAQTESRLVDHTQYFPGWRAYEDGKKLPIEFQDQNWRGLITFPVSPGTHTIKVVFEESKIRFIANALSVAALIGLGLGFLKKSTRKV